MSLKLGVKVVDNTRVTRQCIASLTSDSATNYSCGLMV